MKRAMHVLSLTLTACALWGWVTPALVEAAPSFGSAIVCLFVGLGSSVVLFGAAVDVGTKGIDKA